VPTYPCSQLNPVSPTLSIDNEYEKRAAEGQEELKENFDMEACLKGDETGERDGRIML
jgi:hypothetical protein